VASLVKPPTTTIKEVPLLEEGRIAITAVVGEGCTCVELVVEVCWLLLEGRIGEVVTDVEAMDAVDVIEDDGVGAGDIKIVDE